MGRTQVNSQRRRTLHGSENPILRLEETNCKGFCRPGVSPDHSLRMFFALFSSLTASATCTCFESLSSMYAASMLMPSLASAFEIRASSPGLSSSFATSRFLSENCRSDRLRLLLGLPGADG